MSLTTLPIVQWRPPRFELRKLHHWLLLMTFNFLVALQLFHYAPSFWQFSTNMSGLCLVGAHQVMIATPCFNKQGHLQQLKGSGMETFKGSPNHPPSTLPYLT